MNFGCSYYIAVYAISRICLLELYNTYIKEYHHPKWYPKNHPTYSWNLLLQSDFNGMGDLQKRFHKFFRSRCLYCSPGYVTIRSNQNQAMMSDTKSPCQ